MKMHAKSNSQNRDNINNGLTSFFVFFFIRICLLVSSQNTLLNSSVPNWRNLPGKQLIFHFPEKSSYKMAVKRQNFSRWLLLGEIGCRQSASIFASTFYNLWWTFFFQMTAPCNVMFLFFTVSKNAFSKLPKTTYIWVEVTHFRLIWINIFAAFCCWPRRCNDILVICCW